MRTRLKLSTFEIAPNTSACHHVGVELLKGSGMAWRTSHCPKERRDLLARIGTAVPQYADRSLFMSWNRLSTGLYSSLVLSCLVGSNGVAFGLYSIGAAFFIIDLSLLAMGLAHVGCGGMIIVCVGMYRHYPRIASVVLVIMHLVGIVFYSWLAIACFASSDQVDSW